MTVLHLPPSAVDDLPWFEVVDLTASWIDAPPANEALANVLVILKGVFGAKSSSSQPIMFEPPVPFASNSNDPNGIGAMIAEFPDGHVRL